jgi:hypothetical protein
MKTITKTIATAFGMMALLTATNVNAQTYYGYGYKLGGYYIN